MLIYEQRLASKVASGLLEKSDPGPLNAHFNRVKLPGVGSLSPPGTSKIIYTSGSTGEPKGACLSFEQCLNVARSLAGAVALPKLRHMCVLALSILLEKELRRFSGTANIGITYERGADIDDEWETSVALQSRLRYPPRLEPGAIFGIDSDTPGYTLRAVLEYQF